MRTLANVGSLRAAWSSTAVLKAAQRFVPADSEVVLYDGLGRLPHLCIIEIKRAWTSQLKGVE